MKRSSFFALALAALLAAACSSSSDVPATTPDDAGGGADDAGPLPGDDGGQTGPDGSTPQPSSCPPFGTPRTLAKVTAPDVDEASGLATSVLNPSVYWVHNDSGDSARAFAIGNGGQLLTTLSFATAMPTDIEDMAIEDASPTLSYLYFGDIGDNALARAQVTIHRVAEPKTDAATATATSETMTVVYPDGAHNAETLLFDPLTKDLLIVTKVIGEPAAVHRVGPFTAGQTVTTTKIAEVSIGLATGGDISRDGRLIGIRNYGPTAFVWVREPGESLATALARTPCTPPVGAESQGESLAFQVGNTGFVTISEGKNQDLHVTPIE